MQSIAWNSKDLVKQYNYLSSGHFFAKDTMDFFKSRVTDNYRRMDDYTALFITTEWSPGNARKATIREAKIQTYTRPSDGRHCQRIVIYTVGEFNQLTLDKAKRLLYKL
jgi:hypothetical protein